MHGFVVNKRDSSLSIVHGGFQAFTIDTQPVFCTNKLPRLRGSIISQYNLLCSVWQKEARSAAIYTTGGAEWAV